MNDAQQTIDNAVDNTVRRLRARILDYKGRTGTINEQNTKTTLINPLLIALGWDVENLDEVSCEYKKKPRDNPVDYALFLLRTPSLFVEAKGLGSNLSDRKWITQTLSYASVVGVEWCVLTDGNEYRLYNAVALVDAEEKLFRTITVSDDSQYQRTIETLQLLSKERMSEKGLSVLWNADYVDRRVKAAFDSLVKNQDAGLIRLLRKNVDKLTASEVRNSLQRADIRIDFPEIHDAEAKGHRLGIRQPKSTPKRASASVARPVRGVRTARTARKTPVQIPVSLDDLMTAGLIQPPLQIESTYLDKRLTATILANGAVEFNGQTYTSLSQAAGMARHSIKGPPTGGRKLWQTNGWTFWKFKDAATAKTAELDVLRKQYLASKQK